MPTTYTSNIPAKEWVHERQSYLGGSELAAALGKSPYQTPLQLWMLKTGRSEPFLSTPITEFGHLFEPIMAEKFTELTGLRVRKISDAYEHPGHSFLRGNIDRQIVSSDRHDGPGVLEIKTTNSYRLKNEQGAYPRSWYYQLQHYLMLTGYEYGYIFFFERDTGIFHDPIYIERDEPFIEQNTQLAINWWRRYIVTDTPPDPVNHEDVLILYPDAQEGTSLEANPQSYAYYKRLKNVRSRMDELKEHESALQLLLKQEIGDYERLSLADRDLITWKNQVTNRLDTKALKKDHPSLCEQYTKQTETRRFTIK